MKKVCHITSAHGPEDVRIFHKQCVSLARAGYEVYLVQRGESYEKEGVHLTGFGRPASNRLERMLFTARRAYQTALSVDADVYHFHDPELLPYGLKLKRRGKKVIFDSHEDTLESIDEKTWIPAPMRKMVYLWFKRYQEKACRRVDAVIAVTPHMVDFFRRFNPMTVQVSNFPILNRSVVPPDISSKTLVFAGGITNQWSHHIIIKALERLPDCRYCLCGSVGEDYLRELKQLPGWRQVEYLGKISHEEVPAVLGKSAVGMAVIAYNRKLGWNKGTLGNTKIFEEMMAGLPVVCTDLVLWREFVERYHCGICVDPSNAGEIADAVRYLLDHPDEARRMGENGRRAVEEEFNWTHEEKTLLALYEELTKE